jgi:hypothetical protein
VSRSESDVHLPELLKKDRWAEKTALRIIPLLVSCAQEGRTITYGELDRLIVRRRLGHSVSKQAYGSALDRVGRALQETGGRLGISIPPLNALVVNAQTGVPGGGCDWYMEKYVGRGRRIRSEYDRKAIAEEVQGMVYNFRRWDDILREYGLSQAESIGIRRAAAKRRSPQRGGWSTEGESPEHSGLVQYVAEHPQSVGLPKATPKGTTEYCLPSGDRPDVVFRTAGRMVAIEVKSRISNNADLERGIYQCVKYRALLRAEQRAMERIPNGAAVLVTERPLPETLHDLAELLQVRVVTVSPRR